MRSAVLIVALLCVALSTAHAGRIIVGRFTGPSAAKIQKRVKAIAQLTTFTGDDLSVAGRVKKAGKKRFVLVLVVKDRKTGKTIDTIRVALRTPKLDGEAEGDIASRFADAAAKPRDVEPEQKPVTRPEVVAQEPPKPTPKPTPPPEPPPPPKPQPPPEHPLLPPGPATESKAGGIDSELAAPGSDKPDETPAPPPKIEKRVDTPPEPVVEKGRDPRAHRVEIALGGAIAERTLQFTHDAAVTDPPVGYEGTPVVGGRASAEVYPFALGIAGEIERFTMRSQFPTGEAFDTTHMKWSAGLRFRWNIGSRPTLPTLTFGAGYGQLLFTFDTAGAAFDLPNVQYSFIVPSLRARIPLFTHAFALRLEGRYLYMLGAGAFEEAQNYGGTTFTAVEAAAGFELRLFKHLVIEMIAELSRIDMTFDGTGGKTTMRDADPDQDVTSARDQYQGAHVTLGWAF